MTALIPPQFLFRYTFPVRQIDGLPRRGKKLLNLPNECVLLSLAELNDRPQFGELRLAWNDNGLGVSLSVDGKSGPPVNDPERPGASDSLHLWFDSRNTQSIHRASRFCHHFEILPAGEDNQSPIVQQHPIARAKEEAPAIDPELIPVQSTITKSGYQLEAWFPSAALNGYDPERQPKLGFFYALNDSDHGLQTLTVGSEFPFGNDPSLWSTLELISN